MNESKTGKPGPVHKAPRDMRIAQNGTSTEVGRTLAAGAAAAFKEIFHAGNHLISS